MLWSDLVARPCDLQRGADAVTAAQEVLGAVASRLFFGVTQLVEA